MRTANPPIHLGRRDLGWSVSIRPDKLLVVANGLSVSRGLLAAGIFAMALSGISMAFVLVVASVMWLTDTLDGLVARAGRRRGAQARVDGAALDPLMDDLAFVAGFLILLDVGAVPLWFVAALLGSRVLFALIRMTSLAHQQPFAHPQPVTRFNGAVLAVGQLLLLAHVAFPSAAIGANWIPAALVATMSATTAHSVTRFAIQRHGRTLASLLRT